MEGAIEAVIGMKLRNSFDSGGHKIEGLAFSPTGSTFAAHFGETVVILSVPECDLINRLNRLRRVDAVAFSRDGERLAVGCVRGRVLIFNLDSGDLRETLKNDCGGYHSIAWSPDGHTLAAGQYEPFVAIFDVAVPKPLRVLDPKVFDDEGRTAVMFSSDGHLLATTGYNRVFFWSVDHLRSSKMPKPKNVGLREHAHLIDIAFSGDESTIAVLAESEGKCALHFWQIASHKKLGRIRLPHFSLRLAWCRWADVLAVAEYGGDGVSFWNPMGLRRLDVAVDGVSNQNVTTVAASHDGRFLAAGTERGKVVLWSLDKILEGR